MLLLVFGFYLASSARVNRMTALAWLLRSRLDMMVSNTRSSAVDDTRSASAMQILRASASRWNASMPDSPYDPSDATVET